MFIEKRTESENQVHFSRGAGKKFVLIFRLSSLSSAKSTVFNYFQNWTSAPTQANTLNFSQSMYLITQYYCVWNSLKEIIFCDRLIRNNVNIISFLYMHVRTIYIKKRTNLERKRATVCSRGSDKKHPYLNLTWKDTIFTEIWKTLRQACKQNMALNIN